LNADSVGAVKFRIEAEKYASEAARLRDELAQIELNDTNVVSYFPDAARQTI